METLPGAGLPNVLPWLCHCWSYPRAELSLIDYVNNRNRKLKTSKAPFKSQAQGTSLFTSAASNQRGFPKNSPWEAQVRFPEGERLRQIIVHV